MNGKSAGSQLARSDLIAAINSPEQKWVIISNNNSALNLGRVDGPQTIRLDLADIAKIDGGANGPDTMDSGMIFLHEAVGHAFLGLEDVDAGQINRKRSSLGATVVWENRIRTELGLPTRSQYVTEPAPNNRGYIPFAKGRVWIY